MIDFREHGNSRRDGNSAGVRETRRMMGVQWFRADRVFRGYINIFGITSGGGLYRLHTAILDRPPSSAATMEVQGPDTQ